MKFAFIVPYRDRAIHLNQFSYTISKRYKEAGIFVIEQTKAKPFNRGKLLNTGFLEFPDFDYYAFHDVDMIPEKADYSYPANPTHIATRCSQFRYKMPFPEYFGGVVLFNKADFVHCNGFSNEFWSWGGEDEEMYQNVLKSGMAIERRDCTFTSLHHARKIDPVLHAQNVELLKRGRGIKDGLTNCHYTVLKRGEYGRYTKITVEI